MSWRRWGFQNATCRLANSLRNHLAKIQGERSSVSGSLWLGAWSNLIYSNLGCGPFFSKLLSQAWDCKRSWLRHPGETKPSECAGIRLQRFSVGQRVIRIRKSWGRGQKWGKGGQAVRVLRSWADLRYRGRFWWGRRRNSSIKLCIIQTLNSIKIWVELWVANSVYLWVYILSPWHGAELMPGSPQCFLSRWNHELKTASWESLLSVNYSAQLQMQSPDIKIDS